MAARRGIEERVPYSLSRWTDVSGSQNKWDWFKGVMAEGEMFAFDARSVIPSLWSLKPQDTLGLNFWTKDPRNLLLDRDMLAPYKVKIHMTLTGWEEVEKGAPTLKDALWLLEDTVKVFGPENVIWRFSPVPMVGDAVARFRRIASTAGKAGLAKVYVAFLQENDLMPERRSERERASLLDSFAREAGDFGITVLLCNDDKKLLETYGSMRANLGLGVCAAPEDWGDELPAPMGCGCCIMVDPFSINESCTFGCTYCYAADKNIDAKKHNTTRSLPVVP